MDCPSDLAADAPYGLDMANVAVIGSGYVGTTTAVCLADLGNDVVAVDVDRAKVEELQAGRLNFYEPGLGAMLSRNLEARRLRFTHSYADALPGSDVGFIAVGTPEGEGGSADLSAVRAVALAIPSHLTGPLILVNKSTVPIGSGDLIASLVNEIGSPYPVTVVANPEFLRQGSALHDFMHPDRVVIGSHDAPSAAAVAALYEPLGAPVLMTDIYSAEMIKYAANAFLATKISFMNEMAQICDRVGADVTTVAHGMGLDPRIGPLFLAAGLGFGGSCFPKDVRALAAIARQFDYEPNLLSAVLDINFDQRRLVVDKLRECIPDLHEARVCILGLSFKPNTDDMRDSPSLEVARILLDLGAHVRAYDPVAMSRAQRLEPEIEYLDSAYEAAEGADGLIIATDWKDFKELDLARIHAAMRTPVLVDGRNIFQPEVVRALGFTYRGIGRG